VTGRIDLVAAGWKRGSKERKRYELDLRIEYASVFGVIVVFLRFRSQPEPTAGGGIRRIVGRH
jgi:hypothetical protein